MSPRAKSWFLENWPVIAVAATGLIAWGGLQARVAQTEKDLVTAKTDHDLLIKVSTDQDSMKTQLTRMEGKLDTVKSATASDLPRGIH